MNNNDFLKKLGMELNSYNIDVRFLRKWYADISKKLKDAKTQSANISHPRHLGDYLEETISKIISDILPSRFQITKGFAVNRFSAKSKEQDILIYDSNLGGAICKTDNTSFVPIDFVTASIEVKSNLNLSELRKSLLNCVSIKKLNYHDFDFYSKKSDIFYGIVAYESDTKPKNFIKNLEEYLDDIPESLRPNLIYINTQGVYTPTCNGYITLEYRDIAACQTPYVLFNNNKDAQDILLFLAAVTDYCRKTTKKDISYRDYVLNPIMYEQQIKKNNDDLPELYVNPQVLWENGEPQNAVIGFKVSCSCGKKHSFAYPGVTGEKKLENMKNSFKENGTLIYLSNEKYKCECGLELDMTNKKEEEEEKESI